MRCPFCTRDPFHRTDSGEAVAVVCCDLGDALFRGARPELEEVTIGWDDFSGIAQTLVELRERVAQCEEHHSDATMPCDCCEGGRWQAECCNGSSGCSCRGERVDMGPCNVCHGTGRIGPDADRRANLRTIEGCCYIGSGPRY